MSEALPWWPHTLLAHGWCYYPNQQLSTCSISTKTSCLTLVQLQWKKNSPEYQHWSRTFTSLWRSVALYCKKAELWQSALSSAEVFMHAQPWCKNDGTVSQVWMPQTALSDFHQRCAPFRKGPANRNALISVIRSAHCTDLCFASCRFSQVVLVTSNNFTHNLFFYFQSFLVFDSFFRYLLSTCCSFTRVVRVCATLLGPLRGRNSCCLWLWQLGFGVSLRAATSNLPSSPNPLSNSSVLHHITKHKTVVFSQTNVRSPRISTCYKFAVPPYWLPPVALQTFQGSVEPRLSTALIDRSVVP